MRQLLVGLLCIGSNADDRTLRSATAKKLPEWDDWNEDIEAFERRIVGHRTFGGVVSVACGFDSNDLTHLQRRELGVLVVALHYRYITLHYSTDLQRGELGVLVVVDPRHVRQCALEPPRRAHQRRQLALGVLARAERLDVNTTHFFTGCPV